MLLSDMIPGRIHSYLSSTIYILTILFFGVRRCTCLYLVYCVTHVIVFIGHTHILDTSRPQSLVILPSLFQRSSPSALHTTSSLGGLRSLLYFILIG